MRTVTSCTINFVSPFCNGVEESHQQEASDHVHHFTDQFTAYTGNTDLAILLNKDTFEPNPAVSSKERGAW